MMTKEKKTPMLEGWFWFVHVYSDLDFFKRENSP